MYRFQQKLKTLKGHIKQWNKDSLGNIFQEKERLDRRLQEVQVELHRQGPSTELKDQEWTLLQELNLKVKQEEVLFEQKSRNHWLRDGDRNTKFFHKATIQHRQCNRIVRLKKEDGSVVEKQKEIEETLNSYYADLLEEPNVDRRQAQSEIFRHIPRIITQEHNQILMRPVEMPELEEVVKQMARDKSPGPDGFTTNFFQEGWEWLKEELLDIVESSRKTRGILKSLNATFLALIPKEHGTEDPRKFRPIALCNVIYKIITKIIANRLRPLLPILISPEQAGFVEGRQILDGIILVHEAIHSLKQNKSAGMLLKLDLSKSYDKLNWDFL